MSELFNEDFLVSSPDYGRVLDGTVLPELQEVQENLTVTGKGGVPLFCSVFRPENPRGTVLVLHGFTENAYKYSELIYSLVRNRFDVVAYDQRGHGRSGRAEGISDPSVTHVDRFEDYVEDLAASGCFFRRLPLCSDDRTEYRRYSVGSLRLPGAHPLPFRTGEKAAFLHETLSGSRGF